MKTLITTGCSYTQGAYPTWNFWLGEYYDNHIKLAKAGSGPKFSYVKVRDYFKYTKGINPQDCHVVVQWSSLLRNDIRFSEKNVTEFRCGGEVVNNPYLSKDYAENHFNVIDSTCDLLYYIESLISLSKELGFKLHMFYMFEPWADTFYGEPTQSYTAFKFHKNQNKQWKKSPYLNSLRKIYNSPYFINPSIERYISSFPKQDPIYFTSGGQLHVDNHPSPIQHFEYFKYLSQKLKLQTWNKEWEKIALKLEEEVTTPQGLSPWLERFWDFYYDHENYNVTNLKTFLQWKS